MVKKIKSVALEKTGGTEVDIEADVSCGLPYFNIVGFADISAKEASERVKRAILNSGFEYPKSRVTVNLTPAYLHKKGSHYVRQVLFQTKRQAEYSSESFPLTERYYLLKD